MYTEFFSGVLYSTCIGGACTHLGSSGAFFLRTDPWQTQHYNEPNSLYHIFAGRNLHVFFQILGEGGGSQAEGGEIPVGPICIYPAMDANVDLALAEGLEGA